MVDFLKVGSWSYYNYPTFKNLFWVENLGFNEIQSLKNDHLTVFMKSSKRTNHAHMIQNTTIKNKKSTTAFAIIVLL